MQIIEIVSMLDDFDPEGSVRWGFKCKDDNTDCDSATQLQGCEHVGGTTCFEHQMTGSFPAITFAYPVISINGGGFERGDFLLIIDGQKPTPKLMLSLASEAGSGRIVEALIERGGERYTARVQL